MVLFARKGSEMQEAVDREMKGLCTIVETVIEPGVVCIVDNVELLTLIRIDFV